MKRLRQWWREQTGVDETPLDGETPAWLVSLVVHVALLIGLAVVGWRHRVNESAIVLSPPVDEAAVEEAVEIRPQEFAVADRPQDNIGAPRHDDAAGAAGDGSEATGLTESLAPTVAAIPDLAVPQPLEPDEVGNLDLPRIFREGDPTALRQGDKLSLKGKAGVGTTGTSGAIDRLTYEILQSLEQRKTLVVWLFDATVSLSQQRKEIHDRFDRIYKELGVIESSGNPAFAKHPDKPLLTSVYAFGKEVVPQIKTPTDNLTEIKLAVSTIKVDRSGEERAFSAVFAAADAYKKYVAQEQRNVMLIVFTDEVGSDEARVDETIRLCKKYAMKTYVVGVPAAFGRRETMMKWVDPDPGFDQSAQWGRVDQGPESRLPEVVKLLFTGQTQPDEPVDSGYGPYGLTRLTYETGGIYFAVHPNRDSRNVVTRDQTAKLSAHIARFFDPEVMRKYRPDYLSDAEFKKMLDGNKAMAALVHAAAMPDWIVPMGGPNLHFPKRDEGDLARRLSEAQKAAAKLEPQIRALYSVLKTGEQDRPKIESPRWQAGYDLAMGRVLAVAVRTEAYNAMLAQAKTMKFKDPKSDTWDLVPSDKVTSSSTLEKEAQKAREYLSRVVEEHPGTPWALLAQRELSTPLGWEWKERHTGVNKPKMTPGAGNAPPPADDRARMIPKPPPRRPPPPL
jgi:hypothetical protein